MDLSSLKNIINRLDTYYIVCKVCKVEYDEKWCNQTCFFCKHFNPWRDTYSTIIKEMYWYYIKSGEDQREYYISYLENLKKWCNKFSIVIEEKYMELIYVDL